jgi:hypothetical protein
MLIAIQRARLVLVLLAAVSITLLWASPAKAGTTITQSTCPVVIAQPGEYALGTNVGPCLPGVDGIDIQASNVTLHLNGHTITGSCDPNAIGIHVGMAMSPTTLTQVRVLGTGTIIGFTNGFVADNSAGSFVKFVTITPNCSAVSSIGFDIHAPSSQWKLEGNVVLEPANNRNNSAGIVLGRTASGVTDCDVVRNNLNDSISVHGNNHNIINNTANDNMGGIFVTGNNNEIHANTTDNNNGAPGIQVFSGASGNNISGNTSLNNTPYDMEDDNGNCGTNKWKGNKFNIANMPCIH